MIHKEILTTSEATEFIGTITIDLSVLNALQNKALENEFSNITYSFEVADTRYICNRVEEIRKTFNDNHLYKINNLEITYQKNLQRLTINFQEGLSSTCVIRQSEVTTESRHLSKEFLFIINGQNGYFFKKIAKKRECFFNIGFLLIWIAYFFSKFSEEFPIFTYNNLIEMFLAGLFLIAVNWGLSSNKVNIFLEINNTSLIEKYTVKDKVIAALIMIFLTRLAAILF